MDISLYRNGGEFSLDEESSDKFKIEFNRLWNDWGYYTSHTLYLKLNDSNWIAVCGIGIMDYNQQWNRMPTGRNSVSFIRSINSAIELFLMLTPEERIKYSI